MDRRLSIAGRIATTVIIVIVTVVVFAAPIPGGNGIGIDPVIVLTDGDIRVGEPFGLHVVDVPVGSEIIWELGNDTVLEGFSIEHSFNRSEVFPVTVTVKKDGRVGRDNITIPVKCCDIDKSRFVTKPYKKLAVRAHMFVIDENGLAAELQNGICLPTVIIDIQLHGATGEYDAYCMVKDEHISMEYEPQRLEGINAEHHYHAEIPPEVYGNDIPDPTMIGGMVRCESGDCLEMEVHVQARY